MFIGESLFTKNSRFRDRSLFYLQLRFDIRTWRMDVVYLSEISTGDFINCCLISRLGFTDTSTLSVSN